MLNLEDLSKLTTEQIKKMTEDVNKDIEDIKIRLKKKPIFNSPIDKFTKIDDLLRQNIALQKELIEQMYISNQLSWATLKKSSDGDFISPYPNGDRPIILGGDDDYKTIVSNITNMKISGGSKVFEINGSGIVAEVRFQSSNIATNRIYGVRIVSDNSIVYQDTFANFFNRSFHETDLSCWEDVPHGYYLLVFQRIAFSKNLIVEVYGSIATFSDIYLKYHLKMVG